MKPVWQFSNALTQALLWIVGAFATALVKVLNAGIDGGGTLSSEFTGIRFFEKLDARKRRQVVSAPSLMWQVVRGRTAAEP